MTFDELLAQIRVLLQHEQRISYRALKRRFTLEDDDLEALKDELIYAKQWAREEEGRVLVWRGEAALASPHAAALDRSPLSYTPRHLAEKILTTRAALQGERKQVTVLFADVAGFSTLAESLEPETVHSLMDGCFAILTQQVHQYEGTINQYTGDGIMALFGAPITHEDHAVRALHAALGIQGALQEYSVTVQQHWGMPFQMRLGVNTGTVVVGRIGDDLRMDYTAQGDTVNLAARVQQMALPGAIWVAETTHRLGGEAFQWRALGPLTVRGRTTAVEVYDLCGRSASRSRFDVAMRRGLTRFVGRNPELQHLFAIWHQVQQGHGHVVSVVGEAGLGKSRLLYEFKQQLEQTGTRYVEGTCFTYGGSISHLPFLKVVRALCGLEEDGAEVEAKRHIAAHLATLGLAPTALAPYLHNLLSFTVEDDLFPKLTADLIRQRTVEALKTLVVAEATRHPLALIFEDVHWIDKATEEVVSAVVEAVPTLPLLMVLVYRPEYLHAWAGRAYHARITLSGLHSQGGVALVQAILTKPYAARVPLTPLSSAQSTAMAHSILGVEALPAEVEQLIVHKTDGNPLFIEELIQSLLESSVLARTPEGYHLTRPVETLDLPTTVQGVLLARIDRLRSDLKDVLQVAAVIGRTFSYPLLAQVLQQDTALEQELLELEDLEFIYTISLTPEREYSFKHVLTQEAVYNTLLRPQREVYHEWVGEAVKILHPERLEEYYEMLAYHYVRSGNKDKAVTYLDLANQKAAKTNAMAEAYAYFTEAMQLLDTLPVTEDNQQRRIALLVNQVTMMVLLAKLPEYYDLLSCYQAMAVGVNKPGLLGAFYGRLGWCEWCFGAYDQAIPLLIQAAELCEAVGNAEDAGQAYLMWEWSHLYKGDFAPTLALRDRVLHALERRFNHRWYMWARAGAALAHAWCGRWEQAIADAQQGLRVGEEFADPSVMSFAAHILSVVYTAKGDLVQALAYGERAVQQAPTPADQAWAQAALAWAWCRTGEPQKGVEVLAQVIPMQRAVRQMYAEIFAPCLGEGYWRMGEYNKARQALEEHLALAERNGMKWHIGAAHRLLGEVALHTNPAEAASHFEHGIAVLQQINAENELALAYAGYGRLHAQCGNLPQARTYLSQALDIFERLGTLGEPERVQQALATLPEG